MSATRGMRASGSSSPRASCRRLGTKARPPVGAHGRQWPRRAAGERLGLRASRQKGIVPKGLAAPASPRRLDLVPISISPRRLDLVPISSSPRRLGAPLRHLEKACHRVRHRRQVLSRGRLQANGRPVQGFLRTPSWRQPSAVVSLLPWRARVAPGRQKVFSSSCDAGFWHMAGVCVV